MKNTLLFLCLTVLFSACTPKAKEETFVKRVDHFMLTCKEPKELYNLLVHTFDLPISWEYKKFRDFKSGGVEFGNCVLETVDFDAKQDMEGIIGMAFKPGMKVEIIQEKLKEKDFKEMNLSSNEYWKNLSLYDLSDGGIVFFCEYQMPVIRPTKEPGGHLGIKYVEKVTISYKDYEKALKLWRELLVPHKETREGFWEIETSANIEIVKNGYSGFLSFEVKVNSIEKVRTFLTEKDLIGEDKGSYVETDPEKTYGVLFRFTE